LGEVVLALALGEVHQLQAARRDEAVDVGDERLVIGSIKAVEA
jgi:hypothetical protein